MFDVLRMARSSLSLLPLNPSYSTIFAAEEHDDSLSVVAVSDSDSAKGVSVDKKENREITEEEEEQAVSPLTSAAAVSVVARKPFTVEDFRPQLVKMYYRMRAQQDIKEKHRAGQVEVARQRESEAQEEQQRKELEELREAGAADH